LYTLDKAHNCGFFYKPDQPKPIIGYVVQRVIVKCSSAECVEILCTRPFFIANIPIGESDAFTYYEAWPVLYGEKRVGFDTRFTDKATSRAVDDLRGNYTQEAESRFFCLTETGGLLNKDNRWHNPAIQGKKWHGKLCPTNSNNLMSWSESENGQAPPFWNNKNDGEASATRSFKHTFNCCKPKEKPTLEVEPAK